MIVFVSVSYHSISLDMNDRIVRKLFLLAVIKQSKQTMAQSPRSRAETSVGEKERACERAESRYKTDLSCCVHCIPVTSTILSSSYLVQNSCCLIIVTVSIAIANQIFSSESAEQMKDWHQMKCYVVEEQSVIGLILQIGICNHVILIHYHKH